MEKRTLRFGAVFTFLAGTDFFHMLLVSAAVIWMFSAAIALTRAAAKV